MPGERDVNAVDVILLQKNPCFYATNRKKYDMPPKKGRKGEAGSRTRRPSAAFAAIKILLQNKNVRSIRLGATRRGACLNTTHV